MTAHVLTAQIWICALVGCAAIADDLVRRRISNWIPLAAFASGRALQCVDQGWRGAGAALLGTVAGGAAFLIFYLMGGLGGGDVKLLAGFGAVLGPSQVLAAALWAAGCGGLLAAGAIGVLAIRRSWRIHWTHASDRSASLTHIESIPYAPAIAMGAWLSLASRAAGIPG